ncbi:hypothetical protein AKG98_3533 [Moritella sp. JT01]|uniref:hypothetical protein n=1 Tax=Moritella sp. JT01 TaxID=756698 RepID=UPI0007931847|nr:hypothetical protein [Moritella sp. JT01]KXO13308.1 hypothetical protein AKG98_3533 [Moritella sp. JT01]
MPNGYDEWYLNHIHPVGQDGFKSDEEITAEAQLERSDDIYLQSHPFCEAVFYCSFCDTAFVAKASEKHYCKCGSASLATRIKLRKIKSNYANIRG